MKTIRCRVNVTICLPLPETGSTARLHLFALLLATLARTRSLFFLFTIPFWLVLLHLSLTARTSSTRSVFTFCSPSSSFLNALLKTNNNNALPASQPHERNDFYLFIHTSTHTTACLSFSYAHDAPCFCSSDILPKISEAMVRSRRSEMDKFIASIDFGTTNSGQVQIFIVNLSPEC